MSKKDNSDFIATKEEKTFDDEGNTQVAEVIKITDKLLLKKLQDTGGNIRKSKLKNKGKIIIEVPHAEDFLILQDELKKFKDYTFFSEHLILHTFKSLKTILVKAGFKKINIKFYQRYNFANHLGWFLKRKPGGHDFYSQIASKELDKCYKENLIKIGQTDTLIAVAENHG